MARYLICRLLDREFAQDPAWLGLVDAACDIAILCLLFG